MANPNPIDLATLAAVKNWLNITGTSSDSQIQRCITAWSLNFLRMTGRGPRNWQTATSSPFNQPTAFAEVYDGNGNNKLFLRNFPIVSVASLLLFGTAVPAQTTPGGTGFAIDNQGRAIDLINNYYGTGGGVAFYAGGPGFPLGGAGGAGFPYGIQCVSVNYTAGFNVNTVTDELYVITLAWAASTAYTTGAQVSDGVYLQQCIVSGTSGALAPSWASQPNGTTTDGTTLTWQNTGIAAAPNTVTLNSDTVVLTDAGVDFFVGGTPLVKVNVNPTAGQYYLVAPGSYLFNAANAGQVVQISYTSAGTPTDIVQAAVETVALNYKRRDWIGISSLSMKDVGQTTYSRLAMGEYAKGVVRNYTRQGLAN